MFGTMMADAVFDWVHISPTPIPGDVLGDFNGDGALSVKDIDLIHDLDGDGDADFDDRLRWVRDLRETWIGDTNLDGEFNSGDLIEVFQAGKYELDVEANWAEGDWTGDGRFGTEDLTAAFQDGGYERGPRGPVANVPEPNASVLMLAFCLSSLTRFRRRRRVPNGTAMVSQPSPTALRRAGLTTTCSLLAMLLTVSTASGQAIFDLGNLRADRNLCSDVVPVSVPDGTYNTFRLQTDWRSADGSWSREAIWALADSCSDGPTTTYFTHPGPNPESAKNSDAVTLTWEGFLDIPINGPSELLLLPLQTFGDSASRWRNTAFELSFQAPPPPPALIADLGIVADEFSSFNVGTDGDADTELGVYSPTSRLVAENDDPLGSDLGSSVSSRIEFANGLPAGDYIAAVGMFNTSFDHAYEIDPGAVGGNYGIDVAGHMFEGTLAADEIGYVGFSIGQSAEMNAVVPETERVRTNAAGVLPVPSDAPKAFPSESSAVKHSSVWNLTP